MPADAMGNGVGRPGTVTLGPNGVSDVVGYLYAFDSDDPKAALNRSPPHPIGGVLLKRHSRLRTQLVIQ